MILLLFIGLRGWKIDMATIDSKHIIDALIANDGYYEDDPQAHMIVEYINGFGAKTWGVTWSNEPKDRQERYLIESQFVRHPKVIWCRDGRRG